MRFNINNIEVANDKTRYTGLKDNTKNSMYFPNSNNMTMRGMSTPVKYYGVTDGMITDEGIAYPGQDFKVRGKDTVEFRMPMRRYQNGGRYIVGDQDVTELVNRYNTQGWEGLSEQERDFYMNNYDRIRTFDDSGMEVRHMPEATITANRGKWHSKYGDIPYYDASKSPYSQQNMGKVASEILSQPLQLMNVPGAISGELANSFRTGQLPNFRNALPSSLNPESSFYGGSNNQRSVSNELGIENPVGSFLVDAITDPGFILGAMIPSKIIKSNPKHLIKDASLHNAELDRINQMVKNYVDNYKSDKLQLGDKPIDKIELPTISNRTETRRTSQRPNRRLTADDDYALREQEYLDNLREQEMRDYHDLNERMADYDFNNMYNDDRSTSQSTKKFKFMKPSVSLKSKEASFRPDKTLDYNESFRRDLTNSKDNLIDNQIPLNFVNGKWIRTNPKWRDGRTIEEIYNSIEVEGLPYKPNYEDLTLVKRNKRGNYFYQPDNTDTYVRKFNTNIDELNNIIKRNNKSGHDISVSYLDSYGNLVINTPRGETKFGVSIQPGEFYGNVPKPTGETYTDVDVYGNFPGINMSNTSHGLRDKNGDVIRGTKFYESLNEYLKETGMGRVKSGFNSQSESSYNLWKNAMKNRKAYPAYGTQGIMKAAVPVVGAGVAAYGANREQKQLGGRYNNFKNSLPPNLANTPESEYAMKRYWRSNQRPSSFQDAQTGNNPMFTLEQDNMYHAPSVDSRTNRFLKPKTHATVNYELDWYNSNTPEANEFRSNYKLVDNPLSRYYKYKKR